jgi:YVTN family beta-propeller protein
MEDSIIYSNILTKSCPITTPVLVPGAGYILCSEKYGSDYYAATPGLSQGITVGTTPISLRFNSSRSFLYVANYDSNNVSVVDISTKTVVNTISVGTNPLHLQLDPDNDRMYVANLGGSVSVIDTNSQSVIATISGLPSQPRQVAVDNVNRKLYVSSYYTNNITVVNNPDNLNYTIDRQINISGNSWGITYYNNKLFITSPGGSSASPGILYVYNINTNSISDTIPWGNFPTYTTLLRGNKIGVSARDYITILNADDLSLIYSVGAGVGTGTLGDIRLDPSSGSQTIYSGGLNVVYDITFCPNTIP